MADFESPQTYVIGGIMYLIVLFTIWELSVDGLTNFMKIVFTVVMLPLCIVIVGGMSD